jgi:hypothetical protein
LKDLPDNFINTGSRDEFIATSLKRVNYPRAVSQVLGFNGNWLQEQRNGTVNIAVAVGTIIADRPPAQIRASGTTAHGSYLDE